MAVSYTDGRHWRKVVDDPINVATTASGTSIDVENFDLVTCQFLVTTLGVGTATMYVQGSVDGTNFESIAGATVDLVTTAANHDHISISRRAYAKIRASCTVAATSGSITPYFMLKKEV